MPTKKELQHQLDCGVQVLDDGEDYLQQFLKDGLTFEKISCLGCRIGRVFDFFKGQILWLLEENEKLKEQQEENKKQFNILIQLIKGADTEEKINKLKELPTI